MRIDFNKNYEDTIPEVEIIENPTPQLPTPWDQFSQEVWVTQIKNGVEIREINEGVFAKGYTQQERLRYNNGLFYTPKGIRKVDEVSKDIYSSIQPFLYKDIARKSKALLECVKNEAYNGDFIEDIYLIPFANGDLEVNKNGKWIFLENSFRETPYRLPSDFTGFDTEFPTPNFNKWLSDLLEPEDITTLQDFLGYCLLPTTAAQEALFLIGDGGTGKSVIKSIMGAVFGNCMVDAQRGVQEFLADKFQIPELEYKLVLYDDEIKESALTDTGFFKKLITNTGYITADRKFGQPFKFRPYVRVIACGNFMLSSLYDSTDGFFRRLHPIVVKPKDQKRKMIRGFDEKVASEVDGILQWMLIGLYRVMKNDFFITTSQRTTDYLANSKSSANHFPEFFESVFDFDENSDVSSVEIVNAYKDWCKANGIDERRTRPLQQWISDNCEKYNVSRTNKVARENKYVRGYKGLSVKSQWSRTPVKII